MIQDDSTEISGWVLKAFGDCADLVRDSVNPTEEPPDLHYIGLEHIEEGALQLNGHGFAKEVESNKFHFRRGDILFGKLRPYFRKVVIAPFDGICSTDIWVVRAKKGIEQRYLFYWMASQQFIDDTTRASEGTKMPRAKWDFAARLERYIPPLPEQRTIACILGTLDDKIELNRRMNATLEAMAQAIFKSWFVDFDPVRAKVEGEEPVGMDAETVALFPDAFEEVDGQEVPEGWEVKGLDEIATYLNGLALQKYPPEGEDYLPVIKIAQLRKGGVEGADKASANLDSAYIINDGDVIFSWSGSLAVVLWCGGRGALNQHLFKVTSDHYPKWFYYLWTIHYLPDFQAIAAGKATTMGHIQRRHLSEAKALVPPPKLLDGMNRTLAPLIEMIVANNVQSRTLAALRDTLLPKLISGEIRVPDAMLEVAEA